MSAYIDTITKEYPLHIGDIELRGGLSERFALVEETNPPEYKEDMLLYEGNPKLINGIWKRTWITRKMTLEEINIFNKEKDSFNFSLSDPSKILNQ